MFVIVVEHPVGERWRELHDHPLVQQVSLALSLPSAWVAFRLHDFVTAEQASQLAEQIRTRVDEGTVTVRFREP
ncbi:MAG: hypothetical protein ACJ72N_24255 [Labedaea sp.]